MTEEKSLQKPATIDSLVRELTTEKDLDIIGAHFRNGIGRYSITQERLQAAENEYARLKDKDDANYKRQVDEERKRFKKTSPKLPTLDRAICKIRSKINKDFRYNKDNLVFTEPEKSVSPLTRAAEEMVVLGQNLQTHVEGLMRFPSHIKKLEDRAIDISERETTIEKGYCELQDRAIEYSEAMQTTAEELDGISRYSEMSHDEKDQYLEYMKTKYGNDVDWNDSDVQDAFKTNMRKAMFQLAQLIEDTESDRNTLTIDSESVLEQKKSLQKSVERFWMLYNPAREAAAKLYGAFTGIEQQVEDGILYTEVAEITENTDLLCAEAKQARDALEREVSGRVTAVSELYELEQSNVRGYLTQEGKDER